MRHYGLIGAHLSHSFSKNFFTVKFANEGIDADYSLIEIDDISTIDKVIAERELSGFNVTIPYKESIIPYLDELSAEAEAVGAVNCVVVKNGRKIGYNTDITGIEATIEHHGFVGGLLEHTLGVAKNCDYFASVYPILNRDLLLSAAIFHDIGKLEELSTFPENDYTDEGQLLGHIMIGAEMVGERIRSIEGFPIRLGNELKHCILAHHGELEFGSPKKPALAEALALSFADNIDAKMETLREIFAAVPENNTEWLGFNRLLESNIRRTSK